MAAQPGPRPSRRYLIPGPLRYVAQEVRWWGQLRGVLLFMGELALLLGVGGGLFYGLLLLSRTLGQ